MAFHQQAADELGGDLLGGAGEVVVGRCWEGLAVMGVALGMEFNINTWAEPVSKSLRRIDANFAYPNPSNISRASAELLGPSWAATTSGQTPLRWDPTLPNPPAYVVDTGQISSALGAVDAE